MSVGRLACGVATIGWVACLCSIALTLASPDLANSALVQWSPWLLGLFLVGIPHGALDHRVGSELVSESEADGGSVVGPRFYVAYLSAAGLVLLIWLIWPIAALIGFLSFAAFHFGEGDVYWSHQFGLAACSGSVGYRTVCLISRSLLPIALPLVASTNRFYPSVELMSAGIFDQTGFSISQREIGICLIGLVAMAGFQISWACRLGWNGDIAMRNAAAIDIGETLLLVATFAIVPPVLAIGVYFNAWHSLRHLARLLLTSHSTKGLVESGQWGKAILTLYRSVLPMTCGALLLIAIVPFVLGHFKVSIVSLGIIAIIGLSMLTLPHVIVVMYMDLKQGVWSPVPEQG